MKRAQMSTGNPRSMVYHYHNSRRAMLRCGRTGRGSTKRRIHTTTMVEEEAVAFDTNSVKPPSKFLLAIEGRAVWELGAFFLTYPYLRTAPRGDGHPVLVLPGLTASDVSTEAMRAYLNDLGYAAHGWQLGRNLGHHHSVEGEMLDRLFELHSRYKRKVSLIGWSLGGVFARELAKVAPDAVRFVITLGSPIAGCARATNAWQVYELASGKRSGAGCCQASVALADGEMADCALMCGERSRSPSVPCTSIYSRTDGIVSWQCSLEPEAEHTENIEIEGSHCGLGHNPAALYAIADRLAQDEDGWEPFDRTIGFRSMFYPDPKRGSTNVE